MSEEDTTERDIDRERRGRPHGVLSNGDDKFIRNIVSDESRRFTTRIVLTLVLAFGVQLLTATWLARGFVARIEANEKEITDLQRQRVIPQDVKLQEQQIQQLRETLKETNTLLLRISSSVSSLSTDVAVLSGQVGKQRLIQ